MRVLYFGGFRYPYSTEVYVSCALERAGCVVNPVRCVTPLQEPHAVKQVLDFQPDFILFSKPSPCGQSSGLFLNWCKANNLLTVCWQWDLYYGYRGALPAHFKSDLLFTTDGGHDERFKADGCNHEVLRQGIHKPEARHYWVDKFDTDVAFVGTNWGHRSRRKLLSWLHASYRGGFKHHRNTRGLELNVALAKTKVVVGDSYPSDNYWSNRVYEITGRGGFLLHPKTPGLEAEFLDGEHYVSYPRNDYRELKRLVDYYLENDEEREKIRAAGFWHCANNYTYDQRVAVLLDRVRRTVAPASSSGRFAPAGVT